MKRTLVATVMVTMGVLGIGQAGSEELAGEKLDSGLGSMVYGESLDNGLGTMVYGESLDDGLASVGRDDWKRYVN